MAPHRAPHTKGEMAEWSIAAVLKTVEGNTSGGSNPSLSANGKATFGLLFFRSYRTEEGWRMGDALK